MPTIVTEEKLKFWLDNNWNVLFIGKHGVGKTSIVRKVFEELGLKFRMFSAATMDPWCDFIGVPKEKVDDNGESYLDLVRPKEFEQDTVEALFFDEFNRAHKKVRNATMELIQFKSINDRKFENLRVVWAAINPDDDEETEYDVEVLDPAQKDRFHIHVYMDYKPNRRYFQDNFGPEVASTAISWWNALPQDAKNLVSPRRLDYALQVWSVPGGHLEDVLPQSAHVAKLRNSLKTTPIMTKLNSLFTSYQTAQKEGKDSVSVETEIVEFLEDENNYESVIKEVVKKPPFVGVFVPLMPDEKISALLQAERAVRTFFLRNFAQFPKVQDVMEEIVKCNTNQQAAREFDRVLRRAKMDKVTKLSGDSKLNPNRAEPYSQQATNPNFGSIVATLQSSGNFDDTYGRQSVFTRLSDTIPAELTIAEGEATLKLLELLIKRSHPRVLKRWPNLMGVINNCVENLRKANWDFSEFRTTYEKLAKWVIAEPDFFFELSE